jgi:TPP-dependent pyruvate/acetoin dehydrogenase alpha subunit
MSLPSSTYSTASFTAASGADPAADVAVRMLYFMKLQRAVEERIVNLYRQSRIVGGVYTGLGHEAIGAGATIHAREHDVIFPSHRDLSAYLCKGMTPARIFAHYLGRRGGPTRGRDANLHMGDLSIGIGAFISHMADTVPVAAGVALSFKLRRQPNIVICFNGDGATSRGDWHEGLNIAAVMRLPVVFVCVNNQFAYSTPLDKQLAVSTVAERASGYGMPVARVDGNDAVAVHAAAASAVSRARDGGGPSFIEAVTFRMTGHSAADDGSYVPAEFFESGRKSDPITRLVDWLRAAGHLDGAALAALDQRVMREVEAGVAEADASPYPEGPEGIGGVYAD